METSIMKETLSDGSEVFNVVFVDGSQQVVIGTHSDIVRERALQLAEEEGSD